MSVSGLVVPAVTRHALNPFDPMDTTYKTQRSLPNLILWVTCVGGFFSGNLSAAPAAAASLTPLDDVLWHEVQNRQGDELGAVSDVLAQMPSGRLVFVAIDPTDLFARPKVVPPSAVKHPKDRATPLELNITSDRWLNAPQLDWNAELVIKNTAAGGKIYGYYQQAWREPDPEAPWGMQVVAPTAGTPPAQRYVSLKRLLLNRVETHDRRQAGYVRDFLIDWSANHATHALVSPRFLPRKGPDAHWYAIPISLLAPAIDGETIMVNCDSETLRGATAWPERGSSTPGEATIYRYPAPSPVDSRASRTASMPRR